MKHLRRNLDTLRVGQPELVRELAECEPSPTVEAFAAESGAISLRVDGRLESSAVDPEREGRELAAHFAERARAAGASRLVVFGLGVHTLRFLDEFAGEILVVEPSFEVCRRVLEHVDLSAALARVELVVGPTQPPVLANQIFRANERGAFVAHGPARRRAAELHDGLRARFQPGGVSAPLDIAVIPPLYGGSLPVAAGCANALRELGHRVREIDLSPFLPAYNEITRATSDDRLGSASAALRAGLTRVIGETLLAGFELDPPDLLFALAQAPLDAQTLQRVGRLGISRAFWFCEDFHVMSYWRGITGLYDTIFHVQPEDFSGPLREAGAHGVPLPMGFDPAIHRPVELLPDERARYACDLSFVGAGYYNRVQMLQPLFASGLRIYGTEWPLTPPFLQVMPEPNVRQSSEASNQIFNATRVNLNLHSSPWCDGVNPVGDYLNPRTFELAGARTFQLVDERRDLARAFVPGVEIETFGDLEECRRKIGHFLTHEDERLAMAERAQERALREHTYRHRMEVALDALERGPLPLMPSRRSAPTADAVVRDAADEPELGRILSRIDPGRVLDLDALGDAVAGGEGPLSREEKLLLFMREARTEVRIHDAGGAA